LRIIIERDPAPPALAELELFKSVTTSKRPKFQALLGSLALHIAMLALIAACSRYLSWYHEDDMDWSRFHVEPLRLRLAEPIFFNARTADVPPGAGAHADQGGKSAIEAKLHSAAPGGLQLPSVRTPFRDSSPIILQPDLQPQAPRLPVAPPLLAFWARQAPDLPRPRPREVVVPGRTEAPSPAPKPVGPPVLAVPNREVAAADVNIAMPQTSAQAAAALPVPNTATTPVRLRGVTEPLTASFEALPGQPVNIIALAAERSRVRNVEIPRGLQNVPPSTAGDGAEQATERGLSPGQAVAASRQGAAPPSSGAGVPSQIASAPSSGAGVPSQIPSAPPRGAGVPEVIRIQHPANGNFDVVIMQSLVRDDLPDLAGMLTGSPVFTVYLSVGDQKDWLLEYCVPAREKKQVSAYQIDVEDAGSVTPPYPISTMIPDSIRVQSTANPIVLRGLLTATGSVQVTRSPDTSSSFMYQLVALVNQWQFRPALRNNKPIDVEVLLVIPPRV
jgi:hypothetical protein